MLCVVGICTTCNVVLFQGGLPWRDVCVKTFAQRVTDTSRLLYSPTTFSSLFLKKTGKTQKKLNFLSVNRITNMIFIHY